MGCEGFVIDRQKKKRKSWTERSGQTGGQLKWLNVKGVGKNF